MSHTHHPTASIVIPLFNRVDLTRNCWQSLTQHTKGCCEIIFINNGCTDETAYFLQSIAESSHPAVTVLTNTNNLGFARACNQGAHAARSDTVIFLNNDTLVHPGWLEPLLSELANHPETGVAGARLVYADGSIQHAGVCIDRKNIPYHIFLGARFDDPLVTERRTFRMVTGACMAVRKKEFLALDGFDEEYMNGHEDVDLCLRYGETGKNVAYVPESVVTHLESQSNGRMDHCRFNTERTLRRWHNKLMQDDFNYEFPESSRHQASRPLSIVIKTPETDKRREKPQPFTLRAEALARKLSRKGHTVQIHSNPDWGQDDREQDFVLIIPGTTPCQFKPYNRNVLWLNSESDCANLAVYEHIRPVLTICPPEITRCVPDFLKETIHETSLFTQDKSVSDTISNELEALLIHLAATPRKLPKPIPSGKKVSILMATYNRRDRLPEAIRSVRSQTHENWELIIVNDGGEDVADIVSEFNDPRILYNNSKHVSKGAAINTAFALSSGDCIAYLDDDDIWYPNHLERALFVLCNIPEVRMTYSDTVVTTSDENGKTISSRPEQCPQVTYADLLETNCIPGISVVHERELFTRVGGMDERLEVLIDFDMWRRLAMHTMPYHISEATAEHFIRPSDNLTEVGQITNLHRIDKRRYLANACRILSKKLPQSIPPGIRELQRQVRQKVQVLFLTAQGDHFMTMGDSKRSAACYRLAAKRSLGLCREFIAQAMPQK